MTFISSLDLYFFGAIERNCTFVVSTCSVMTIKAFRFYSRVYFVFFFFKENLSIFIVAEVI